MPTPRFLQNLNFWSTAIAALALILTQLPPLLSWYPKHDLGFRINALGNIATNLIGTPAITLFMDMSNNGNRNVEIYDLKADLKNDAGDTIAMPITFKLEPSLGGLFPITGFNLAPGESAHGQYMFSVFITTEKERINSEIDLALKPPMGAMSPTEIHQRDQAKATALAEYDLNNNIRIGSYTLTISAYDRQGKIIKAISGHFSIYNHHTNYMKEIVRKRLDSLYPMPALAGGAPISIDFKR